VKKVHLISFFVIVLTIYSLVNLYIFIHGWQALPQGSSYRTWYVVAFLFVSLCFIAGRILERVSPSVFTDVLIWIGSFWPAAMLYFFLAVVILDLARLVNSIFPYYPSFITDNYARVKQLTAIVVSGLVIVVVIAGFINAVIPRIRTLDIHIPKVVAGSKVVNIVAVSDIHLGTMIGRLRLSHLVDNIDRLHPDLVLFPGDIVDEDLGPVIRKNLGEMLRDIKTPLGVYAVTGNHEYIGGVERACDYLTSHNITMLRDTAIKVNGFYLMGREDRSMRGFARKQRKPLAELMSLVDTRLPVILLDHQPFELEEVAATGIDLQISGHTHNGQLWPLNFITARIYELSWGYKKIGNTNLYVSCGYGTWGPLARTDSYPEIVNIKLSFD